MMFAGRLNSTYLMPRDGAWPAATRARLDAIAARDLPAALAGALENLAAARNDRSIWIFRRLHFDAALDAGLDDVGLAGAWAQQLMGAVARRIDDPDCDAVHFQDEADLLRSYLNDAAATRPRKWYHRRFEGLDYLSVTARIRTAACTYNDGLEALLRMDRAELRAVIGALSDFDARLIWNTLSPQLPEAPFAASLRAVLDTWESEGRIAPDGAGEYRWALHMALAVLRGATPGERCWTHAARPLGCLVMVLRGLDRATCCALLEAIAHNRQAELRNLVTLEESIALEPLLGTNRDLLDVLLDSAPIQNEAPERRYTPFGAVFLLLPFLDALPVLSLIQPAPLFRFWVFLKCMGGVRAMRAFEDPVLRSLFDVDPALSAESFRRWQGGIPIRWLRIVQRQALTSELVRDNSRHRALADRRFLRLPGLLSQSRARDAWLEDLALLVLRSFAWRLPGFSTSSLAHLYENFLHFAASVEEHPERRVVRLAPPPLQLLLNMTGICRARYRVAWLADKPFELYPEAP